MGLNLDALGWLFFGSGLLHVLLAVAAAVLLYRRQLQRRTYWWRGWLEPVSAVLFVLFSASCGATFLAFMFARQLWDVASLMG